MSRIALLLLLTAGCGVVESGDLGDPGTPGPEADAPDPTTPAPEGPVDVPAADCPALSNGGSAVATFESLGIYWTPPSSPGDAGCDVRYREATSCDWHDGLPLWFDNRDIGGRHAECRGSVVNLKAGTTYVVQVGTGGNFTRELRATTWSDSFPIGETVELPAGTRSAPLNITSGGTEGAYKLYTGAQTTIDVANAADNTVTIAASFVIVRGLTLKNARRNGIELAEGVHDVVIEDNDISGWGRNDTDGWGMYGDAGIYSNSALPERIVIQRNAIHNPRIDANSWGEFRSKYNSAHPRGPNGIYMVRNTGRIVIRYNDIYSDANHMYNDAIGGDENFSDRGFPAADSDIYGNTLSHAWDDAVESEGSNRNVRIWGNYIDNTATGVATSSTSVGPIYIWRNVYNRSRTDQTVALDSDDRLYFDKGGDVDEWGGGRRYLFHNTLLQAPPPAGSTRGLGAGMGVSGNGTDRPVSNTVSRNNIWHIWVEHWGSIETEGGGANDMDHDLYNGRINAYSGAERNGIHGVPVYQSGHGYTSCLDVLACATGRFQLAPTSRGYDEGALLPNFNDDFLGAAPDIGAHEGGSPPMRFGRR